MRTTRFWIIMLIFLWTNWKRFLVHLQGVFGLVCLWAGMVWHKLYKFCSMWGSVCFSICSLPFKYERRCCSIRLKRKWTRKWEFFGWYGNYSMPCVDIHLNYGFWNINCWKFSKFILFLLLIFGFKFSKGLANILC